MGVAAHQENLHHGEGEALGGLLAHEGETPRSGACIGEGESPAVELHRSRVGNQQSGKETQERRLARAVGADHADELAPIDGEIDAVDDRRLPRLPHQAAGPQQGAAHSITPPFLLWMRTIRLSR